MALVTTQEVKDWVAGDGVTTISGVNDTVLTACIVAAGEVINDYTSRVWERTTFTRYLNGDDAYGADGERLRLDRSHFPLTYPTDTVTVSENGVSLSVGQGYTTSVAVLIENAGLEMPAVLVRQGSSIWQGWGGWSPGRQNIQASYFAGFVTIPESIKYPAKELSWLLYQEGRKVGIDNVAQAGSSRALVHRLSAMSIEILNGKLVFL